MSTYELIFLGDIPYITDNLRNLYYYDPSTTWDTPKEFIHIGYNREGTPELVEDWRERLEPRLAAWKLSRSATVRGNPISRATKPSRAKRTTAGSAKAKSAPSPESGHVVDGTSAS